MAVPDFTKVGFASKTHGVRGQLRVHVEEGYEEVVATARALFFNIDGSMVPQMVEGFQPQGDDWLFEFKRLVNKEEAQVYAQSEIFVETYLAEHVEPATGHELVGWKGIESNTGTTFLIKDVEEYPEQWMMSVEVAGELILVPLVEDWILTMDEERKEIRFNLPEGLV